MGNLETKEEILCYMIENDLVEVPIYAEIVRPGDVVPGRITKTEIVQMGTKLVKRMDIPTKYYNTPTKYSKNK